MLLTGLEGEARSLLYYELARHNDVIRVWMSQISDQLTAKPSARVTHAVTNMKLALSAVMESFDKAAPLIADGSEAYEGSTLVHAQEVAAVIEQEAPWRLLTRAAPAADALR